MKTLTAMTLRTVAITLGAVLATGAGESAFAQRTSALQDRPATATTPLIQCTAGLTDAHAAQPCKSRHENGVLYASGLTRQEFECALSGNCVPTGNAGRA